MPGDVRVAPAAWAHPGEVGSTRAAAPSGSATGGGYRHLMELSPGVGH